MSYQVLQVHHLLLHGADLIFQLLPPHGAADSMIVVEVSGHCRITMLRPAVKHSFPQFINPLPGSTAIVTIQALFRILGLLPSALFLGELVNTYSYIEQNSYYIEWFRRTRPRNVLGDQKILI